MPERFFKKHVFNLEYIVDYMHSAVECWISTDNLNAAACIRTINDLRKGQLQWHQRPAPAERRWEKKGYTWCAGNYVNAFYSGLTSNFGVRSKLAHTEIILSSHLRGLKGK